MMEHYKSKNYHADYDKGKRLMTIRRRIATMLNDKQVICFGAGLGLSKLALERWAGQILKRLDQGSTEDEANVWIHAKMNEFRF
jgi:hypothetical protein